MVNPDKVSIIQSDTITTPDILGVNIGHSNVLDNNIGGADDTETLALDGGPALTDERLVAAHRDTQHTGVVVRDGHGRCVGLVVGTPVVLVDGHLAGGCGTPGRTTRGGGGALGACEVVGALDDDDSRLVVAEVAYELVGGGRVDGCGTTSTSNTLGETSSGS